MSSFKNLLDKLSERQKRTAVIALCVILAAVLVAGEFAETGDASKEPNNAPVADEYLKKTEKELENLLEKVDGAGDVRVMITLESCYENVYAKGYEAKNDLDGEQSESDITEDYVIVKKGSNTEEGIVIKVYEPVIKGVAVVSEGAGSPTVKAALTEAVCALFDISSAKVSVIKGYKE